MKKLRLNNRSVLFYKYFLSYFVLFCIPFFILSFFFVQRAVDNLQEDILQGNRTMLEQIRDEVDHRIIEAENIARNIGNSPDSTPYQI